MPAEPHRFSKAADDLIASFRRVPSDGLKGGRRGPSRPLAELIDAIRSKHGIGRPTAEQAIRDRWAEVVGDANASYSHAVQIDASGRLLVHVSHAVVRNELFMHREEILDRIRRIPGGSAVKRLHLAQG